MKLFLTDSFPAPALRDPAHERARKVLLDRVNRLRVAAYADPGDIDTREALADAEDELRAFDRRGGAA